MTDHDSSAPLTEDDVAAIEAWLLSDLAYLEKRGLDETSPDDVRRLVADWRRLRADLDHVRTRYQALSSAVAWNTDHETHDRIVEDEQRIMDGRPLPFPRGIAVLDASAAPDDAPRNADDVVADGWAAISRAQAEAVDAEIMGETRTPIGEIDGFPVYIAPPEDTKDWPSGEITIGRREDITLHMERDKSESNTNEPRSVKATVTGMTIAGVYQEIDPLEITISSRLSVTLPDVPPRFHVGQRVRYLRGHLDPNWQSVVKEIFTSGDHVMVMCEDGAKLFASWLEPAEDGA